MAHAASTGHREQQRLHDTLQKVPAPDAPSDARCRMLTEFAVVTFHQDHPAPPVPDQSWDANHLIDLEGL